MIPLTRVIYSIAKFCDVTGLSETAVVRAVDGGTLRTVRIGHRRLILAQQPRIPPQRAVGYQPASNREPAPLICYFPKASNIEQMQLSACG
jgi:hypothetical protein